MSHSYSVSIEISPSKGTLEKRNITASFGYLSCENIKLLLNNLELFDEKNVEELQSGFPKSGVTLINVGSCIARDG